jgi:predicted nucleic acid-binding protein
LERDPFFDASSQVVAFAEQGKLEGWICGTTVTTIHYLLAKALNRKKAEKHIKELLKIFHLSNVTRVVLEDALVSGFTDYEDAVLYQSAIHANLDTIVTRNGQDFQKSERPVYSPTEFLKAIDILK